MAAAAARRPPRPLPTSRSRHAATWGPAVRARRGPGATCPGRPGGGATQSLWQRGEPPGPAHFGSPGDTIEWRAGGGCGGRWVWEGSRWPSTHGGSSCLYSLLIHRRRLPAAWVGERYRGLSPPLSPPPGEENSTSQRLPFFQRSGGRRSQNGGGWRCEVGRGSSDPCPLPFQKARKKVDMLGF